jgi:hypothetical protein
VHGAPAGFGTSLTQRPSWFVLVQDVLTLLYAAVLVRTARTVLTRETAGEAEVGSGVRIP